MNTSLPETPYSTSVGQSANRSGPVGAVSPPSAKQVTFVDRPLSRGCGDDTLRESSLSRHRGTPQKWHDARALAGWRDSVVEAKEDEARRAHNSCRSTLDFVRWGGEEGHTEDTRLPTDGRKLEWAGNAHFASNNFARSAASCTAGVREADFSEKDAHLKHIFYTNRACANLPLKNCTLALSDAQKAIDHRPNYVRAHIRKGLALIGLDKPREATEAVFACAKICADAEEQKLAAMRSSGADGGGVGERERLLTAGLVQPGGALDTSAACRQFRPSHVEAEAAMKEQERMYLCCILHKSYPLPDDIAHATEMLFDSRLVLIPEYAVVCFHNLLGLIARDDIDPFLTKRALTRIREKKKRTNPEAFLKTFKRAASWSGDPHAADADTAADGAGRAPGHLTKAALNSLTFDGGSDAGAAPTGSKAASSDSGGHGTASLTGRLVAFARCNGYAMMEMWAHATHAARRTAVTRESSRAAPPPPPPPHLQPPPTPPARDPISPALLSVEVALTALYNLQRVFIPYDECLRQLSKLDSFFLPADELRDMRVEALLHRKGNPREFTAGDYAEVRTTQLAPPYFAGGTAAAAAAANPPPPTWRPCKVLRKHLDGSCDVQLDGGVIRVSRDSLRPPPLLNGLPVTPYSRDDPAWRVRAGARQGEAADAHDPDVAAPPGDTTTAPPDLNDGDIVGFFEPGGSGGGGGDAPAHTLFGNVLGVRRVETPHLVTGAALLSWEVDVITPDNAVHTLPADGPSSAWKLGDGGEVHAASTPTNTPTPAAAATAGFSKHRYVAGEYAEFLRAPAPATPLKHPPSGLQLQSPEQSIPTAGDGLESPGDPFSPAPFSRSGVVAPRPAEMGSARPPACWEPCKILRVRLDGSIDIEASAAAGGGAAQPEGWGGGSAPSATFSSSSSPPHTRGGVGACILNVTAPELRPAVIPGVPGGESPITGRGGVLGRRRDAAAAALPDTSSSPKAGGEGPPAWLPGDIAEACLPCPEGGKLAPSASQLRRRWFLCVVSGVAAGGGGAGGTADVTLLLRRDPGGSPAAPPLHPPGCLRVSGFASPAPRGGRCSGAPHPRNPAGVAAAPAAAPGTPHEPPEWIPDDGNLATSTPRHIRVPLEALRIPPHSTRNHSVVLEARGPGHLSAIHKHVTSPAGRAVAAFAVDEGGGGGSSAHPHLAADFTLTEMDADAFLSDEEEAEAGGEEGVRGTSAGAAAAPAPEEVYSGVCSFFVDPRGAGGGGGAKRHPKEKLLARGVPPMGSSQPTSPSSSAESGSSGDGSASDAEQQEGICLSDADSEDLLDRMKRVKSMATTAGGSGKGHNLAEWKRCEAGDGSSFYFNRVTGDVVRNLSDVPSCSSASGSFGGGKDVARSAASDLPTAVPPSGRVYIENNSAADGMETDPRVIAALQSGEWVVVRNLRTGHRHYYCPATKHVTLNLREELEISKADRSPKRKLPPDYKFLCLSGDDREAIREDQENARKEQPQAVAPSDPTLRDADASSGSSQALGGGEGGGNGEGVAENHHHHHHHHHPGGDADVDPHQDLHALNHPPHNTPAQGWAGGGGGGGGSSSPGAGTPSSAIRHIASTQVSGLFLPAPPPGHALGDPGVLSRGLSGGEGVGMAGHATPASPGVGPGGAGQQPWWLQGGAGGGPNPAELPPTPSSSSGGLFKPPPPASSDGGAEGGAAAAMRDATIDPEEEVEAEVEATPLLRDDPTTTPPHPLGPQGGLWGDGGGGGGGGTVIPPGTATGYVYAPPGGPVPKPVGGSGEGGGGNISEFPGAHHATRLGGPPEGYDSDPVIEWVEEGASEGAVGGSCGAEDGGWNNDSEGVASGGGGGGGGAATPDAMMQAGLEASGHGGHTGYSSDATSAAAEAVSISALRDQQADAMMRGDLPAVGMISARIDDLMRGAALSRSHRALSRREAQIAGTPQHHDLDTTLRSLPSAAGGAAAGDPTQPRSPAALEPSSELGGGGGGGAGVEMFVPKPLPPGGGAAEGLLPGGGGGGSSSKAGSGSGGGAAGGAGGGSGYSLSGLSATRRSSIPFAAGLSRGNSKLSVDSLMVQAAAAAGVRAGGAAASGGSLPAPSRRGGTTGVASVSAGPGGGGGSSAMSGSLRSLEDVRRGAAEVDGLIERLSSQGGI